MEETKSKFKTSLKTRVLYSVVGLGVSIQAESIGSGIVNFFMMDVMHMPVKWFMIIGVSYTVYHAIIGPLLGFVSDKTKSRWGRRIPYVKFTTLPYALSFMLLFAVPWDGRTHPIPLIISYTALMITWQTLYTCIATGYYGLLPEMFVNYEERTDVAAKMNIFQILGLFIGVAVPPELAKLIGWWQMAAVLGGLSLVSMYIGKVSLFETESLKEQVYIPFLNALKSTFINKGFIAAATAQCMRFFGTGILTSGMMFYLKYSLKVDEGMASVILGITFVVAAAMLYPWRQFVANRSDSRTTLMLADLVMIIGIASFGFGRTLTHAYISAFIIGTGVSGLVLNGDVLTSEVVDDDHLRTGQQRAGMFFGMMGLWISLSDVFVKTIFGFMMPYFGYDTKLTVQPETVAFGFRLFMTIPAIVGFLLSMTALYFYPLNKNKLAEIKAALLEKEKDSNIETKIQ